jgi:hypothetical protein
VGSALDSKLADLRNLPVACSLLEPLVQIHRHNHRHVFGLNNTKLNSTIKKLTRSRIQSGNQETDD